ncbi:MAG: hypothetical protein AAGK97_13525 [Bacteroidota bacterium]
MIDLDYFLNASFAIFVKMILIPQRLFDLPNVSVLMQDGNTCILEKILDDSALKKESLPK